VVTEVITAVLQNRKNQVCSITSVATVFSEKFQLQTLCFEVKRFKCFCQ